MGKSKAEMGRVREEKKKKYQKEKSLRRKKIQVREKVGKWQNTVFPMVCGRGGRKVGSLKRRVRSHVVRWEMKNCAPLWREAHVPSQKCTKHISFWALLEVEMSQKVHAVVARSTFWSQILQDTTCTRHFWTLKRRFAWQAQGIVHLVKSEQNVRVLWHFQKRWQAWGIWRGSAKMHFPWQAQCKRHAITSNYATLHKLH